MLLWGAAIAQWIRLRLPSCRPRFEYQAYHLSFKKSNVSAAEEFNVMAIHLLFRTRSPHDDLLSFLSFEHEKSIFKS